MLSFFLVSSFSYALDVESKNTSVYNQSQVANKNYNVAITDNGFEPEFISIRKGNTVTWISRDDNAHWPASDLHPTHTRYPGSNIIKCGSPDQEDILDACNGLKQGGKYTFTFDKAGEWTLHDHLNPQFTMAVVVKIKDKIDAKGELKKTDFHVSQNKFLDRIRNFLKDLLRVFDKSKPQLSYSSKLSMEEQAIKTKKTCSIENRPQNIDVLACYSKEFQSITIENGPEYAFKVLNVLQEVDETAKICHLMAHGIGWGVYQLNPDDWQKNLASINPTCVYGALHGILEQYISNSGEGKLTKEDLPKFCEIRLHPACIHAVGHIILVETKDNLTEAIELCDAYPLKKRYRHYCLTGAFMEHMIADNLVQHGLYPQSRRQKWYTHIDDFEELCRSYEGEPAIACWTEIVHASTIKFRKEPEKVFDMCNTAQIDEGAKRCRRHAIGGIIALSDRDLSSLKYLCTLEQDDREFEKDCYLNFVAGEAFSVAPEEATEVVDFCASLDLEFKGLCFSRLGKIFKERLISKSRMQKLCQDVSAEFRDECMGDTDFTNTEQASIYYKEQISVEKEQISTKEIVAQIKEACSDNNRLRTVKKETCYSNKFVDVAYKYGQKNAFNTLIYLQTQDLDALKCHFIGHGIGSGIYKRDPHNSLKYIETANTFCSYGVAMGIIEELYAADFLKGNFTNKEILQSICTNKTRTGCNHILGHVLLPEKEGNVNASLESCKIFSSKARRTSCFSGVFMEYVYPTNLIAHGYANKSWLNLSSRFNHIEKLCRSYDGRVAVACWGEIARVAIVKYDRRPKTVFDFCNTAQTKESARECKLHAIGIFTVEKNFDLDSTKSICSVEQSDNPEFERICLLRIVDSVLNVLKAKKAPDVVEFCSSLDTKFQRSCFRKLSTVLVQDQSTSRAKMLELCKNVSIEFKDMCVGITR